MRRERGENGRRGARGGGREYLEMAVNAARGVLECGCDADWERVQAAVGGADGKGGGEWQRKCRTCMRTGKRALGHEMSSPEAEGN